MYTKPHVDTAKLQMLGITVTIVTALSAIALVSALIASPDRIFERVNQLPVKFFLAILTFFLTARLGWGIYRFFHLPTARRFLISTAGIVLPACFACATFPGITGLFDAMSINLTQEKWDENDGKHHKEGEQISGSINRSSCDWQGTLVTCAGLGFGVLAGMKFVTKYTEVMQYEQKYGALV